MDPMQSLKDQVEKELETLQAKHMRRQLAGAHRAAVGSSNELSSSLPVDFRSNDYLGFSNDALLKSLLLESLEKRWKKDPSSISLGNGASRLVHSQDESIEALEDSCCELTGFESAVYLQSGFAANLCFFDVLKGLSSMSSHTDLVAGPGKEERSSEVPVEIFLESSSHASLFVGAKLSACPVYYFHHSRLEQLRNSLIRSRAKHKIVCLESLHSMEGILLPVSQILKVARDCGALVYLDEAHSFGIYGENGMGILSTLTEQEKANLLCVMIGFGKACGISGGALLLPKWLRMMMANTSRPLIYSTSPSPLLTYSARFLLGHLAGEIGAQRRAKLWENVELYRSAMGPGRSTESPIQMLLCGTPELSLQAEQHLSQKGFLLRAIRPPTVPRDKSRLRIVIHAQHSQKQVVSLCKVLISQVTNG